jgi:hypothetical protein
MPRCPVQQSAPGIAAGTAAGDWYWYWYHATTPRHIFDGVLLYAHAAHPIPANHTGIIAVVVEGWCVLEVNN